MHSCSSSTPVYVIWLDRSGVTALAIAGGALGLALVCAGTPVEVRAWPCFQLALAAAVALLCTARCAQIVLALRRSPTSRVALPWSQPGEGRRDNFDRAA